MSGNTISLIKAVPKDLKELQDLARRTFSDAYGPMNTEADMRLYLEIGFSDKKMRGELKNPDSHFYLIRLDGKAVAYLKVNLAAAQTNLMDPKSLEIERIYVLKELQGRQIGQMLLDKALEVARENELEYIWLGVWQKNHRAIRFYERHGFRIFDTQTFTLGADVQEDWLMRLDLPVV